MGSFDKFKKDKISGAKKKEQYRQEKRNDRAERQAWYDEKKKKNNPAAGKPADAAPASGSSTARTRKPVGKAAPDTSQARPSKVLKEARPAKAAADKPSYARPPMETPKAPARPFKPRDGKGKGKPGAANKAKAEAELMPLNKYIAHGGLCSRRDAAEWIKAGRVKVNGQVITEPGYKVQPDDMVKADGKRVEPKQDMVYILMNKPKDFLTTAEDDKGRKTVLDIVKGHVTERVYPVGRLDRNTTGVLLLTNDGDLAQQLSHPKFEIRKVYEAHLDKPITKADLDKLVGGIVLEDGPIAADAAAIPDKSNPSVVGIELHSGRNRIVRRMFEHLGYDVRHLDRVVFANLTKKNVERGKWRFLNEKEIRLLKYFNKSKHKEA